LVKAAVVYDSKFGNTEQVALRLAILLEDRGIATKCMKVGDVNLDLLADVDILAVGGPTHTFGMSKPMDAFMKRMNGVSLKGKVAFAFDTRFESYLSGSAAKRIEARLIRLGARMPEQRFSAFVTKNGVLKQDQIEERLNTTVKNLARSV